MTITKTVSNAACGIDFGTSNSTVAVISKKFRGLVPLEDDKTTLPSALFFKEKSRPAFGREAIADYTAGETGRFMRGLKKTLGTPLMEETTRIGNKSVTFEEILKIFLDHLKQKSESFCGESIEDVVLGRPVHFHDNDMDADKKAEETLKAIARKTGFKNIEFLYEPIAAAFAHEEKIEHEKLSLVVDLGGGTSDFTVIRVSRNKMKQDNRSDDILSSYGVRIGGTTFDYRLSMKKFMPELGLGTGYRDFFDRKKVYPMPTGVYFQLSDWALVNFAQTPKSIAETMDIKRRSLEPEKLENLLTLQKNHYGHRLLGAVENTKISLTDKKQHEQNLEFFDSDVTVLVDQKEFEAAIEQDVMRIRDAINESLLLANVDACQIELVILTGGSTELPIINHIIQKTFPDAGISQGNKLDSVGMGLAYRAANIF